jgi:hypothetical protein
MWSRAARRISSRHERTARAPTDDLVDVVGDPISPGVVGPALGDVVVDGRIGEGPGRKAPVHANKVESSACTDALS